jgi:RNA polymerase sigma factor (sigma-70 family)
VPGSAEARGAEYRPLLFSIAYGMTGSVGDAEDIVQDAFLGLARAHKAGTTITDPKAYLSTAVTRLGINYLSSARVRRETYVGDWLPEPVVVPTEDPGPAEHTELADSLSMAFLVLLESLSPVERAVFMLREVFGYRYPEVARITGKSEVNCRQIFARARRRIADGGQAPDSAPPPARRFEGEQLARRFFEAAAGGDIDALLGMLAPDVVFHADGGGKAQAVRVPVHGRGQVARMLVGLFRRGRSLGTSMRLAWVNGQPGAVGYDAEGRVFTVFELEAADGVVDAINAMVNPDKLGHIGPVSDLARLPEKELPHDAQLGWGVRLMGQNGLPLSRTLRTRPWQNGGGEACDGHDQKHADRAAGRVQHVCRADNRERRAARADAWLPR